jgi:hypothetical protein
MDGRTTEWNAWICAMALVVMSGLPLGCNGGGEVACTDANIQPISAVNYSQSCNVDSDCAAVGAGNACYPCTLQCPSAAISNAALAAYHADVSKTIGGSEKLAEPCGCPSPVVLAPCCRGGVCHLDEACLTDAASE